MQTSYDFFVVHWNGKLDKLTTLKSLAAPDVVLVTTSYAVNNYKVANMSGFHFQRYFYQNRI